MQAKINQFIKIGISIFFLLNFNLFGQQSITYNGSGTYILRERTNLRRYDNGKYIGLVSREISSYILPVFTNDGYIYEGNFYVTQDTRRNSFAVGRGLTDSIPAKFKIASDGSFTVMQDNGFPTYRGFPTYTNQKIKIGDTWNAKAVRAIDPLNKGIITKIPIYVQYKYVGDDLYNDEEVFVLSAQWATRYGMGVGVNYFDWGGDSSLVSAQGSHKANIYVSKISGNALVIHDTVDETFEYNDGNKYTFRGQISQFTEYPPAIDKFKVLRALQRIALISDDEVNEIEKIIKEKNLASKQISKLTEEIQDKILGIQEIPTASDEFATSKKSAVGSSFAKQNLSDNNQNQGDRSLPTASDEFKTSKKSAVGSSFDKQNLSDNNQNQGDGTLPTISDEFKTTKKSTVESKKSEPLVVVEETRAGLRLTLPNLQFLPNSAELVPGEKDRLDKITFALKEAGEVKLLIEGHTARIGTQDDELQLSIDRAHTIATELTNRGILTENLICKGSGGTKPIADNNTPEGREKNRRVEITILSGEASLGSDEQ